MNPNLILPYGSTGTRISPPGQRDSRGNRISKFGFIAQDPNQRLSLHKRFSNPETANLQVNMDRMEDEEKMKLYEEF